MHEEYKPLQKEAYVIRTEAVVPWGKIHEAEVKSGGHHNCQACTADMVHDPWEDKVMHFSKTFEVLDASFLEY